MSHQCITSVLHLFHLCITRVSARGPLGHGDGGGPSWREVPPFLGMFAGRVWSPLTLKSRYTQGAPLRGIPNRMMLKRFCCVMAPRFGLAPAGFFSALGPLFVTPRVIPWKCGGLFVLIHASAPAYLRQDEV